MTKAFKNLITILLICLVATGISITTSPMLTGSMSTVTNYNDTTEIWLASSITETSIYNPTSINISLNSNSPVDLSFNNQYLFNIVIHKEGSIYKKTSLHKIDQEFLSVKIDENMPYIKEIDLSQSSLDLPNGEYQISISPNIDNKTYDIKPLVLHINYLADIPYDSATSNIPDGKMAVPLYFSDANNIIKELIGITRFVDTNKGPLNTTISELQKGPKKGTGLNDKSPIGKVEYVTTVDNITYINLSSEEKKYTSNPIESQIAMKSFIKSLSSIEGVNRVKFLVDNNKASTFFNGVDISKSIKYEFKNKVYMGYNSYKKYYLIDCDVEGIKDKMTLSEKVEKIAYELKNKKIEGLFNTIPKEVDVLNYSLNKNILSLNFNDNLLNSFNKNVNLQRLMIDAIVFSFTSLDGIDYVEIKVNGNSIDNLAGVDISKPLKRPLYINPENM